MKGDRTPVGDDVQVVAPQNGLGHLVRVEQASDEPMEELGLAILGDALEAVIAQARLERRQRAALKEAQHPAVEHQLLVEAAFFAGRSAGLFLCCHVRLRLPRLEVSLPTR